MNEKDETCIIIIIILARSRGGRDVNEKDLKNESHIIIAAEYQKILIFRTNFFSGRMLCKQLTTKIIIFRAYFFSGRMDERSSTICSGEIIYYNNIVVQIILYYFLLTRKIIFFFRK